MRASEEAMGACDPHRFVKTLDQEALDRLVARLEGRARDPAFTALLDKYAGYLPHHASARLLEVGCGTGATLRRLARRAGFASQTLGVDQSPHFIAVAERLAREEGLAGRMQFLVGDAHELELPTASFDAVIAHTVLSHVTEPAVVLDEMARVVRPGGTVIIFDGDYSSLTYAFPDHRFGQQMDRALAVAGFNNPRIMRDLPRLLPEFGLELMEAWGDALVEIGHASYFDSFAETYLPYVRRAGLLPAQAVEVWQQGQRRAMERGTFFAACNYYTFVSRRAGVGK